MEGDSLMSWLDIFPSLRVCRRQAWQSQLLREKYIWTTVRILHETEKAILIDNGMKIWIPKSQIYGIRLRNNFFQIYVKESTVG